MKTLKTNHIFFFLFLLFLFFNFAGFSQTFDEYKKKQNQDLKQYKEEYNKKFAEIQGEFDKYVKQQDEKFAKYLKEQWDEFQVFAGKKLPEKPKPVKIPVYKPSPIKIDKKPDNKKKIIPKPESEFNKFKESEELQKISTIDAKPIHQKEDIILPLIQESSPVDFNYDTDFFTFFGNKIQYEYDSEILECKSLKLSSSAISNWFKQASNTNYNRMVNNMLSYKDKFALNDWAYFLLLEKAAVNIFSENKNQANLLFWFMMLRSGYDVKLAYANNICTVMFPSRQTLYAINYLSLDGINYYMRDKLISSSLSTYKNKFAGSTKIMDFNIYYPMNLSNNSAIKSIDISYEGEKYHFNLEYNPDMIDLYNNYPVVAAEVYFDASITAQAKDALAENILPVIKDMTESEAANFLLYFTQNAFEYQIDETQFGKERFLFPEETLYYPYSDCEDRSAFYAYLVKEFLKIDIVGLEYPMHIATAIKLESNYNGDYISYNGNKYIIADPTFINAPVGRAMPQYKNTNAKVIALNNFRQDIFIADKYWTKAFNAGAFRGGINQDHVFDNAGNCYLTGYFLNKIDFGEIKLKSSSANRQCFVAKFTKKGKLQWVKNLDGSGVSTGISISQGSGDSPLVMGTYSGNLKFGRQQISSTSEHDIFVLKLKSNGEVDWLSNAGISDRESKMFLKYAITFDPSGNHLKTDLFTENPAESSEGIFVKNDGDILIAGAFNNTTGLNTRKTSFADEASLNYTELIKAENDELINSNVNKSIAGLFAVINLARSNGMNIPGKSALKALDKYNPRFKKECPVIYENIAKVTFMKNAEGIITIRTNNGRDVRFDNVKLKNNAKVKITSFASGDKQMNILSGISVGKYFIWYNLNFVRMYQKNGDLLFDYDSDHTQKIVNMKDDILEM